MGFCIRDTPCCSITTGDPLRSVRALRLERQLPDALLRHYRAGWVRRVSALAAESVTELQVTQLSSRLCSQARSGEGCEPRGRWRRWQWLRGWGGYAFPAPWRARDTAAVALAVSIDRGGVGSSPSGTEVDVRPNASLRSTTSRDQGSKGAVAVFGTSGSAGSTLLRALSGLVPHFHGGRFPVASRSPAVKPGA